MGNILPKEIEELLVSYDDAFEKSGPTHLSKVDWTSPQHRRSVAASLVQGAYSMERNHHRSHALAEKWWSFFHFELKERLIDDDDQSIFGVIYEFKPPFQVKYSASIEHAPRFVVAFRGTMKHDKDVFLRDFKLDINVFRHCLHKSSRCDIAKQAVQRVVSIASDSSKIWLAGHSLGASVATVVGKGFAHTGVLLESFLFNPPFVSLPTNLIKNKKLKKVLVTLHVGMKVVIAMSKKDEGSSSVDSFDRMSSWIPHLFVNHKDLISTGYIGYFENWKTLEERGMGGIARLTAPQSIRATIREAFGKECEPVYLLPSANLTIANKSKTNDLKLNHGIQQWWARDMDLYHKQYRY